MHIHVKFAQSNIQGQMKPVSDQFKSSQCFLVAKLIWIVYTSFQVQKWNLEDSKPMQQITNRVAWIFYYFKSKTSMHAPLEEMQVVVLKNSEWNGQSHAMDSSEDNDCSWHHRIN